MKRAGAIIGTLTFFCILILCAFALSGNKTITRSSEWAKGKIPIPDEGTYDVIVVGSDPEGVTAAIGAARSGAKTLLLGKEDGPGGLLTYGMLNTLDMNRNKDGTLLTRGIFNEFFSAIGKTESFDVEKAKKIFSDMIANEKNLEYLPNHTFMNPILEEKTIVGVTMKDSEGKVKEIYGKRIIDATQDGDVCAASGVPYYVGMEDINVSQKMAATLVFKVGGVKWEDIEADIDRYKKVAKDNNCGFNKSTVWGFGKWCYDKYKPLNKNMQLRGPNMGLQEDGTILINALQIFDVDGLDENSKTLALQQGKEEAANIVEYLRKILKSFENAELIGTADELYIRETRHIQGEYVLQATDVLGNVNFNDKIAVASYPIDIQATSKNNTGYVIGSPNQYSIPLGCIVPLEIDNLFIVGRSASFSSTAAGSARVVPTGMVVGESAGITAVYTIYKKMTPRELLLPKNKTKREQLKEYLTAQSIYLPEFNYGDPNSEVEGYEKIKKLINLGMLSGGYSNNFYFTKDASISGICNLLVNALQRGGREKYDIYNSKRITQFYSQDPLTGGALARVSVALLELYTEPAPIYRSVEWSDEEYSQKKQERVAKIEADAWEIAKKEKLFSEEFGKDDVLNYRQTYVAGVDVIERFLGRELSNSKI